MNAYVCLGLHKCSVPFMAARIVWCVFLAEATAVEQVDS